MPRPKRPSTKSIKLIYNLLTNAPKCFGDIVKETSLHRNTVGSTLGFLLKKEMLKRSTEGHKVMYEINKEPPDHLKVPWIIVAGWETPWIELMTTKKEKEMHYRRVEKVVEKFRFQRELDERVGQSHKSVFEKLVKPPSSQELIKVLEESGMKITPRILLDNLKNPFCLDCLKRKREFVKARFKEETKEFCCPECGLVLQREPFTDKPPRRQVSEDYRVI